MKRLLVMFSAGWLAACGGQDSATEAGLPTVDAASEAAPGAAAVDEEEAAKRARNEATDAASDAPDN